MSNCDVFVTFERRKILFSWLVFSIISKWNKYLALNWRRQDDLVNICVIDGWWTCLWKWAGMMEDMLGLFSTQLPYLSHQPPTHPLPLHTHLLLFLLSEVWRMYNDDIERQEWWNFSSNPSLNVTCCNFKPIAYHFRPYQTLYTTLYVTVFSFHLRTWSIFCK